MATVISKEQWFRFHEATALIKQHRACSEGRAEALVRAAAASGEVRSIERGVQDFSRRYGSPVKKISVWNKADLLDWLDRQVPPPAIKAVPSLKGRRYFDDDLVAEGVAGIRRKKWPNPLQAATALAQRARGASQSSIITRLRKKITTALGE